MTNDLKEFIDTFNIVDNALDMRTLKRWNGRDLLHSENLSEHTHLVVVYAVKLYDRFKQSVNINFENLIRLALVHDSLEILRGDILSVTKNTIPGLREYVTNEETTFVNSIMPGLTDVELDLVDVADAYACFKFVELEYERPHNRFTTEVYISTKNVALNKLQNFANKHGGSDVSNT